MPLLLLIGMFNAQGFIDLTETIEPVEQSIEIEIERSSPTDEEQVIFIKENIASMSDIDVDYYCKSNRFNDDLLRFNERHKFIPYLIFKGESKYKVDETIRLDIQRTLFNMCNETGIDYLFLCAVAKTESSFRPNATHVNIDGPAPGSVDQGIFQINSAYELSYTSKYLDGGYDLFNWYDNCFIAVERFKEYFVKYGDYQGLACAWNKGQGRLQHPDYDEVQYVVTVFKYYDELYENYINNYMNYLKGG